MTLARLRTALRTAARRLIAPAATAVGCLMGGAWAQAAGVPPAVEAALARANVPKNALSIAVAEVGQMAPLMSHRPNQPVNPASLMKLITTFAGLDLLGPEFTWKTRVYADGPVRDGVLLGNLYLRGGGDPKLTFDRLDDWLRQLRQPGAANPGPMITQVMGDIVLDSGAFDLPAKDPFAFDGDGLRPYNVPPDAMLVNFGSLLLTFTPDPGRQVAVVRSEPPVQGLAIDAAVPLSQEPCGDWRGSLRADFTDRQRFSFAGRYPLACGERVWPVAFPDGRGFGPRVVEALWRNGGGQLGGTVREGSTPRPARLLRSFESLPLAEVIADINKFSNNVMAQLLYLTLGQPGVGPGGAVPGANVGAAAASTVGVAPGGRGTGFGQARSRLDRWWRERFGPEAYVPVVDNGSGLSRDERTTANALLAVLQQAAAHPQAPVYASSLSVAGVDGTARRMGERHPNSEALGQAQLKTGTLRDVTALAGYVSTRSGKRLAMVAIINHPNAPAARPALDALVDHLARRSDR
jgi:D-alanyl-D-alanine carboxypeptidase/D-alanyl-D-alanine-endopeptidase (penicillin-binding protein 4)